MSTAEGPSDDDGGGTPQPLTIAQLAELAQVSIATVSKVVNGRAQVGAGTRALIEGLIREHGYRPRRRRAAAAPLVELAFHAMDGEYLTEIAKGVERVAREHRLAVVLSQPPHPGTAGEGWIEGVLGRRPTGVIAVFSSLTEAQRDQLATRRIPLVLLDPEDDPSPRVPSVGANNWNGGLMATRHLLGLGHRRIAAIAGPDRALPSRARLDGYRSALDLAGVPADPALIGRGDFLVAGGLAEAERLLRLPDPPTAIFTCNDGQAAGVYRAAYRLGLRIPDELSVVGFDDLPVVRWMNPPLTTVRQPLTDMAATATELLLGLARGELPARHRIELGTELIVRESTAPVPG
ncbi:LacI family DNA-binding transcriptional regulator [Actinomadura sp. ATCC 31491]|uniref:LacI family DNA-binding transcriptional regulator n=1 Tax=Actinomadura luzonensis TaxID=2805427 RepID=A0ABT0G1S9_9ACTN|nr:LacI family DNA-binding transcriptional regulator [Actinomadura luzonensis]MCK2218474.1 LacI family DNA-binding transcriptional regulator [Actinomadura luzonensis]